MNLISKALIAGGLAVTIGFTLQASSHREALAILNEPCADNTDTYAWVSPGAHDKLYLIMDFNPLHEPGQGNQGFRACNGYRYEFHIGKGESLKDQFVYRVEFTNTLKPEAGPSATDGLGSNRSRSRATDESGWSTASAGARAVTARPATGSQDTKRRFQPRASTFARCRWWRRSTIGPVRSQAPPRCSTRRPQPRRCSRCPTYWRWRRSTRPAAVAFGFRKTSP